MARAETFDASAPAAGRGRTKRRCAWLGACDDSGDVNQVHAQRKLMSRALNTAQVLWDEKEALRGAPLPSAKPPHTPETWIPQFNKDFADLKTDDLGAIYQVLNADNRWGLCLSGGGIRSAAFAFGVLQCFAGHRSVSKQDSKLSEPVLGQFDYFSTVSGGGYAGSWLSAWLFQERIRRGGGGANAVLTGINARVGDHQEVGARRQFTTRQSLPCAKFLSSFA